MTGRPKEGPDRFLRRQAQARGVAERPQHLRDGEHCVCEFEPLLGLRQPNISQHLAILRTAHLVNTRRAGGLCPRGLLLALLIAGTLQVGLLTGSYAQFTLPIPGIDRSQDTLNHLVPFDASRGEEGVSVQGAILIALLALIGRRSALAEATEAD